MKGREAHRERLRDGVPSAPLRVLVVEDSEYDAVLLVEELRRGLYEPVYERVCTAEEMEKALERAKARGEEWQIVVSDYYMPRFSGPDALTLLRRLGYDTPFIVVSGKIGEEAAVAMMRAGAQDYVTKDNLARLCPAIERELREAAVRKEREEAQKALEASENRFRRLVEQAADAMLVFDLEGNIVDVNRRACEALGYTGAELLRMSMHDVEVGRATEDLGRLWEEVSGGGPRNFEGVHRRRDGATFPVEVRIGVFELGGHPLMLALARDVTERKEAEKRLREAERRFRTLVEQIPAITYIQSPDGNKPMSYVSPQLEEMLGYSPEDEVIDDDFLFRTVHPEDRERFMTEDRRTDETGEPFRIEYRMTAKDGRIVWIRDEAVLVRDEKGDPLYWLGVQYDITDLKRIEEDLRESEERYRTFIEQSTEGIWRLEFEEEIPTDLPEDQQIERFYRHGYLAECNDAMARMYGFSRAEEMEGVRLVELLPPSVPENGEYLRAAVRSGYRLTGAESQEPDREGERRYFLNNLTGIIEDGRLVRVWGTQRDITERKAAEEELRYSEERFRVLAEEVVEGLALNEGGKLFDANRSFTEMFGYKLEEVVGMDAAEFVAPEKREEVARRIATGDTETYESTGLKKDGTVFPIEVRPRSIPYFGRVVRVTSIIDLSERKRAEEALRASEERYRAVVEQTGEGIFLFDPRTKRILEANRAFQEMFGYSLEELEHTTLYELVPQDPEGVDRNVERALKQRQIWVGERTYRRKDGSSIDVEVSGSVISYGGGELVCSVVHDITERKEAERRLSEVREAERNRIARDLHDDILQDIVYALQEIQIVQITSQGGGDEALEDAADALRRSVEGLRGAIFELRVGALSRSFISSLEALLDLNRRMARNRYELVLTVEEEFPAEISERTARQLTRVVQEALTNVRRHAEARRVEVRLWREGETALLEVADDGRGFDTRACGVGVGQQSMVQRVSEIGGELEVESAPGEGTRVRVRVPVSRLLGSEESASRDADGVQKQDPFG